MNCTAKKHVIGLFSGTKLKSQRNALGREDGNCRELLGAYCGCTVAVKQIHDLILSPHNIHLFNREMNIACKCRHPHLLQFIGATNDEGTPLFVTELMEKNLCTLLEQRQLSETEIVTAVNSMSIPRFIRSDQLRSADRSNTIPYKKSLQTSKCLYP